LTVPSEILSSLAFGELVHCLGQRGGEMLPAAAELTPLHAAWVLIGWVLVLIVGVAHQVVPMLQISQP